MRAKRALRAGVLVAAVGGLGATGCESMNNTEKGALAGGALGTAAGLGVGALTNNPKTGAVIGGLAGAAIGGMAGADKDDRQQQAREVQQAQAIATAQAQQRMGLTDVIHMAQQGHDDQVIINQIRATGSTFQLTASDLDFLKNNSVSARVIAEMQTRRPTVAVAPTRVVVREAPTTVIYQEPVFGPPVYVGPPRPVIYGGYYRRW